MKKNDCSVAKIVKIVLVVVGTLAALAAVYAMVQKLVCKKKKASGVEVCLGDEACAGCAFDSADCDACPMVEELEYADAPVDGDAE